MRLALLLVSTGGVATAAPQGRIVRIEEARSVVKAPLVCGIRPSLDGLCLGVRPRVGDVVAVVDEHAVRAELEISRVEPVSSCSTVWSVQASVRAGALGTQSRSMAIGERRYRTMDHESIPSPANNGEEKVVLAYDRDGDRQPDVLVTRYNCDANGAASQQNAVDRCIDIYTRTKAGLVRQSQTRQMSCRL